MTFTETTVHGAYGIDLKRLEDERGFFARAWCADTLRERGLNGARVRVRRLLDKFKDKQRLDEIHEKRNAPWMLWNSRTPAVISRSAAVPLRASATTAAIGYSMPPGQVPS
jgi:hypothetical protein